MGSPPAGPQGTEDPMRRPGAFAKRDRSLQNLSRDELVKRVLSLEDSQYNMKAALAQRALAAAGPSTGGNTNPSSSKLKEKLKGAHKKSKPSSFHRHPTRKVALLFAYEGWHYAGLAIQPLYAAMQTVEGELLATLEKTHLIEQGKGWDGCDFSRCGRTDRGVSSAGQVVTLWIKSKRRKDDGGEVLGEDWRESQAIEPDATVEQSADAMQVDREEKIAMEIQQGKSKKAEKASIPLGPGREFSYPAILNRVLPPTIRVLAWSPLPNDPEFDARFSTKTRHYRYFFSSDPLPGRKPLDLDLMQAGADRLLGENDFRNFCKLDGAKQIDNYYRTVLRADIKREGGADAGQDCVFELVGSAFLWHQVRHIMAILFLIGHGLEKPEIVTSLLNTGVPPIDPMTGEMRNVVTSTYASDTPELGSKPQYQMAAALPLQLFRCSYDEKDVDWRFGSFDGSTTDKPDEADSYLGVDGLLKDLKTQMLDAKIRARHIESFYDEALRVAAGDKGLEIAAAGDPSKVIHSIGAGESLASRRYISLLDRPLSDSSDQVNEKWRQGAKYLRRNGAALTEETD